MAAAYQLNTPSRAITLQLVNLQQLSDMVAMKHPYQEERFMSEWPTKTSGVQFIATRDAQACN